MKTTLLLHSAIIPTSQFLKELQEHNQMYASRFFLQAKTNEYIKKQTPTLDFIMREIADFMSKESNWRFISHNVRENRDSDNKISWELDIYYYDPITP
jgi:hypothetical protein